MHEQEVVIIKVLHFYPTSCLEHNNYSKNTKLTPSHFHLCKLLCISVYQLPKHRKNMTIMFHILDLNRLILLLVSICDKYPWHYHYIPWKAKLYSLSCRSFGVYQQYRTNCKGGKVFCILKKSHVYCYLTLFTMDQVLYIVFIFSSYVSHHIYSVDTYVDHISSLKCFSKMYVLTLTARWLDCEKKDWN